MPPGLGPNAILARHTRGALAAGGGVLQALNLVTPQLLSGPCGRHPVRSSFRDDDAVLNKGVRHFFVVPWGKYSMVGTRHLPWRGDPAEFAITRGGRVQQFVDEILAAYRPRPLGREQVLSRCTAAWCPDARRLRAGPKCSQLNTGVRHHLQRDGFPLSTAYSVVGVKWTTARSVGEEPIRRCARKLGMGCVTRLGARAPERTNSRHLPPAATACRLWGCWKGIFIPKPLHQAPHTNDPNI
jgi:glycerol-3-phosphate dehydrogenase